MHSQNKGIAATAAAERRDPPVMPPGDAVQAAQQPESLSAALKRQTRDAHRRAEKSGIIRQLVCRQASRASYIAYLANLYPVYRALEQRLAAMTSPAAPFDVIAHPGLFRKAALEQDLNALAGSGWRVGIIPVSATRAYTARIEAADATQLAAHAYVRYLGDLNGGKIIARLLRESLQLEAAELSFYQFPEIGDPTAFCAGFRSSLDAMSGQHTAERIIDEALTGFRLATEQSIEIAAAITPAV